MDIGTAKPTADELSEAPHFFINNKDISELYGAGHFEKDAIAKLEEQFKENDIVFLVGGSGLYINAVLNGVDDFIEVPAEIREQLNTQFEENGIDWLKQQLQERDPEYFNSVDINNPQRVIRALEVCIYTEKPYSSFLNKKTVSRSFTPIKLLINLERSVLYDRINKRVDQMMKQGLLEEVKQLSAYKNVNALKTVGYKELNDYLDGHLTLETAVDKIKQHTRNYAKRQLTWFRNQDEFEEFNPHDIEKIKAYIDIIVTHG